MAKITGVCCGCQSIHGVHYDHQEKMFLMDNHDFPKSNSHCDGSCQRPQVVFVDGKQIRDDNDLDVIRDELIE